ncbi:hypothetical protein FH972_024879 [Carpinus fangiana]|uniref:Methyltransferase domain-containing protein n=1 Tax=Carpinus fangiana TaxID=176857 RepID=A0A5N6KZD5_9ROSI|nr:hypothetical protein FH972_024879 [Carpinus fangiana]
MPRLSYELLHHARRIDPLLIPLLHTCRSLPSAENELRWLREHVASLNTPRHPLASNASGVLPNAWRRHRLERLVTARSRGTPLQYLLGTEFFGDLELKVRPGVLIPRRETAVAIENLASLLRANGKVLRSYLLEARGDGSRLNILDLCTGTGCIPLLLQRLMRHVGIPTQILGIDISPKAVALARENGSHVAHVKDICSFDRGDIFAESSTKSTSPLESLLATKQMTNIDILVSNPPYVSPRQYLHHTERSVRNFEPKLALVPVRRSTLWTSGDAEENDNRHGDAFYPRLLQIANTIIKPKVFWCEVGDLAQAERVAAMAVDTAAWDGVQIWADEPAFASTVQHKEVSGNAIKLVGEGHGRSVICWRDEGRAWLGL